MTEENLLDVEYQMKEFGIVFRHGDLPLRIGEGRKTCGKGGKFWYHFHSYRPIGTSRDFVVGSFGRYGKGSVKVEWDREGATAEQIEHFKRKQAEDAARDRAKKAEDARVAALSAADLWRLGSKTGRSAYLDKKGVEPESCRFLIVLPSPPRCPPLTRRRSFALL